MNTRARLAAAAAILLGLFARQAILSSATVKHSLQQEIVAQERKELDALKEANWPAFAKLFAEDAVFLNSRGFGKKAEVLRNVAEVKVDDYSMEDVRVTPLGEKTGLIVYKLKQTGTSHGKAFTEQAFASAIWVERDGAWVCIFTQETPAQ